MRMRHHGKLEDEFSLRNLPGFCHWKQWLNLERGRVNRLIVIWNKEMMEFEGSDVQD